MSAPRFGHIQKATAIVPLAVLSMAWTASLAGVGATTAVADNVSTTLPDGTEVPTQAIEAPASVSLPGVVAPAIPTGQAGRAVATASTSGIPSAALAAYQRAESVINSADKSCNLSWQLVAAIGRVESDHGRFGGNTLDSDGVAQPGIYGIALDGTNNTRAITDTDAGQYDNDVKWDRAVGPMQFIPSTWSVVGVDGDNDGKRNPQDVDDAALATAVYLCSGNDDLSTTSGQRASVFRYNHSDDYVDLVLSIMQAYLDGDFVSVANSTTSAGVFMPDPTFPTVKPPKARGAQSPSNGPRGSGTGSNDGAQQPAPVPTEEPAPTESAPALPAPTKETTKLPLPTPSLPSTSLTPVDEVLTFAEAQAQCLASGISALNVAALNECVNDLLNP